MIAFLHLTVWDVIYAAVIAWVVAFLILDHPWQKREEVSEAGVNDLPGSNPGGGALPLNPVSLTSLRAGERGQAGAPFDWDTAA